MQNYLRYRLNFYYVIFKCIEAIVCLSKMNCRGSAIVLHKFSYGSENSLAARLQENRITSRSNH